MGLLKDRLREAMSDRDVDQSVLARAIGVTPGTISLILSGKTRQSKYLVEIAAELGVSYDWLRGRASEKHSDRTVDARLAQSEVRLLALVRKMAGPDQFALARLAETIASAGTSIELPSEAVLEHMFEALLDGIDPSASRAEIALLLARRLPIGLSQVQDVSPDQGQSDRQDDSGADAVEPTHHRELTR